MSPASLVRPAWRIAHGEVRLDRYAIVGVLNLTPDSFWSESRAATMSDALAKAESLIAEGAAVLDVGGESTRPGAARVVGAEQEIERVVPIVREIARRWPETPISVDTTKPQVAEAALEQGASIINDVSGLRLAPELAGIAARAGAGLVLMHSRGGVTDMASYALADYGPDPVGDVIAELTEAIRHARAAGVDEDAIVLDPGLGFAKRTEHSVAMIAQLPRLLEIGLPVMLGPSRKRFIGELAGGLPVQDRLPGTIAACVAGLRNGARLFRVHDVGPVRRALDVASAILASA